MLGNEKLLFDELYEKTKDCGRVQFVKLLMTKERENKELKAINKEYERLNKKNGRGFKITNVQEYNIDELLSYKENWNKLKEWLESNWKESQDIWFVKIINKMQELEQGSDSNE